MNPVGASLTVCFESCNCHHRTDSQTPPLFVCHRHQPPAATLRPPNLHLFRRR
ncbi:hypothetical protein HanRHA438_Chr12g0569681 [Helianthus annuus]|nr:hypothetical protein HanIR_Chr12g0602641 [Helianthus annuus]KAJ0868003.1 hypothetical protein HanRHA438_Chr12g0569681 [Helianthus annuus]